MSVVTDLNPEQRIVPNFEKCGRCGADAATHCSLGHGGRLVLQRLRRMRQR